MGIVMWQFWGGRLRFWDGSMRIWGWLCGSFRAGGSGYGGWCLAVLGRETDDMWVVMLQFWVGRLRIWGLLCLSFGPGG